MQLSSDGIFGLAQFMSNIGTVSPRCSSSVVFLFYVDWLTFEFPFFFLTVCLHAELVLGVVSSKEISSPSSSLSVSSGVKSHKVVNNFLPRLFRFPAFSSSDVSESSSVRASFSCSGIC